MLGLKLCGKVLSILLAFAIYFVLLVSTYESIRKGELKVWHEVFITIHILLLIVFLIWSWC